MIAYALEKVAAGFQYIKSHPQLVFVFALLIVIPLIFLYSGQQFLDAGRANQDRLQKDKIGVLHDVFASLIIASNFNESVMQIEVDRLSRLNYDIVDFRVSVIDGSQILPVAALQRDKIGLFEPNTDLFYAATADLNQSLIFEVNTGAGRVWLAYRAVRHPDGRFYVIHTENTLRAVDNLFTQRERSAMFSLLYIFIAVLGLAYWHVRLTDYRYLYLETKKQSESKDTFINMMAHELRAPLTAIKGYADLLIEKSTDDAQKQYASRISLSSMRLIELVNDLLDVARIQSGKLSLTLGHVDVSAVITSVIHELTVTAQEKSIVIISKGIETPHRAMADRARLHQAMTNILSNSIKYTEKGQIEIVLTQKARSLEIRVKDTGMGITAEDQHKMFNPFFRVQRSEVEAITGTGLGMWITKQLITLMHGSVGIESIRGVGTHIVVELQTQINK
jgi:signal transduction histidine kinase